MKFHGSFNNETSAKTPTLKLHDAGWRPFFWNLGDDQRAGTLFLHNPVLKPPRKPAPRFDHEPDIMNSFASSTGSPRTHSSSGFPSPAVLFGKVPRKRKSDDQPGGGRQAKNAKCVAGEASFSTAGPGVPLAHLVLI